MTPRQIVLNAEKVVVMFGLANVPGEVEINITKTEALRLVKAHELKADDHMDEAGQVSSAGKFAIISFFT